MLQPVKASYRAVTGIAWRRWPATELVARPLLERFHPDLAGIAQPLAGESVVRRSALDLVVLDDGYGIEIGLLIDIYSRFWPRGDRRGRAR